MVYFKKTGPAEGIIGRKYKVRAGIFINFVHNFIHILIFLIFILLFGLDQFDNTILARAISWKVIKPNLKFKLGSEVLATGTERTSLPLGGGGELSPLSRLDARGFWNVAAAVPPVLSISLRSIVFSKVYLVDSVDSSSSFIYMIILYSLVGDQVEAGSGLSGIIEKGVSSLGNSVYKGSDLGARLEFCSELKSDQARETLINLLHPEHRDEVLVGEG